MVPLEHLKTYHKKWKFDIDNFQHWPRNTIVCALYSWITFLVQSYFTDKTLWSKKKKKNGPKPDSLCARGVISTAKINFQADNTQPGKEENAEHRENELLVSTWIFTMHGWMYILVLMKTGEKQIIKLQTDLPHIHILLLLHFKIYAFVTVLHFTKLKSISNPIIWEFICTVFLYNKGISVFKVFLLHFKNFTTMIHIHTVMIWREEICIKFYHTYLINNKQLVFSVHLCVCKIQVIFIFHGCLKNVLTLLAMKGHSEGHSTFTKRISIMDGRNCVEPKGKTFAICTLMADLPTYSSRESQHEVNFWWLIK